MVCPFSKYNFRKNAFPLFSSFHNPSSRFVRWSDGSLQLLVGDEALDVAELDMGRDHNFLFLRHIQAQLLEARAAHSS